MIFSESDDLSGLIVDRYADYLTVQITSGALNAFRDAILDHLQQRLSPQGDLLRIDEKTASNEGMETIDQWGARHSTGKSGPGATEWAHSWRRPARRTKNRYYLDQRTNHAAAAQYLFDRRVLDICCYSGGFGLMAAATGGRRGAWYRRQRQGLEAAAENAARNSLQNIHFQRADCFEYWSKP